MGGLDHLFGGEKGAAAKALADFKRTYGAKDGQTVFDATVIKRGRGGKAGKKKAPPFAKGKAPPFVKGGKKRSLAEKLLGD
jgi:hypothetical protein